jgi:hypothetical protein
VIDPIVEPTIPVFADEKFQQALEMKPLPGKYVYNGKMPFAQPITTTTASGPDAFIQALNGMAKRQAATANATTAGTSTTPLVLPTPAPTSLRDFSYVAFADEQGFLGVKSTTPSTGSLIMDIFVTASIQPTTFRIGNDTLVCPLGYCSFLKNTASIEFPTSLFEFPTFLSLLPTYTKKKSDLVGMPFAFTGIETINGRASDCFQAGSDSTLQVICFDQGTHVPSKYSNALGYSMELTTVQTTDYVVESSYPSAMGLYLDKSACSTTTVDNKLQRQLTLAFMPLKSLWNGTPRSVELQFFSAAQNPIAFPNATPTFTQAISISGKRGEAVSQTTSIPLAQAEKYSVRACMGSDCMNPIACDFSSSGINTNTTISPQACAQAGGTVIYDIGDGSTIRNGCGFRKTFLGVVPVGIEGGICCREEQKNNYT